MKTPISIALIFLTVLAQQASALDAYNVVEVFVASSCTHCDKMISFLRQKNIAFKVYDLELNPKAEAEYFAFFGRGILPAVRVNGRGFRGFQPEVLLGMLAPEKGHSIAQVVKPRHLQSANEKKVYEACIAGYGATVRPMALSNADLPRIDAVVNPSCQCMIDNLNVDNLPDYQVDSLLDMFSKMESAKGSSRVLKRKIGEASLMQKMSMVYFMKCGLALPSNP